MLWVFGELSLYEHVLRKGVRCEKQQKAPTVRSVSEKMGSLPYLLTPIISLQGKFQSDWDKADTLLQANRD